MDKYIKSINDVKSIITTYETEKMLIILESLYSNDYEFSYDNMKGKLYYSYLFTYNGISLFKFIFVYTSIYCKKIIYIPKEYTNIEQFTRHIYNKID
jgi:hypothetical protein